MVAEGARLLPRSLVLGVVLGPVLRQFALLGYTVSVPQSIAEVSIAKAAPVFYRT
jgi:hypothetical protein